MLTWTKPCPPERFASHLESQMLYCLTLCYEEWEHLILIPTGVGLLCACGISRLPCHVQHLNNSCQNARMKSTAVKGLTVLSMWAMVDMCSCTADCTYRQPCIFGLAYVTATLDLCRILHCTSIWQMCFPIPCYGFFPNWCTWTILWKHSKWIGGKINQGMR